MKGVRYRLLASERRFEKHPFFAQFRRGDPQVQLLRCAPQMTFWILAFQDLLMLNERRAVDPAIQAALRRHRRTRSEHPRRFAEDLSTLGAAWPGALDLFEPSHRTVRETSYSLLSPVLNLSDDLLRLVAVLALDSATRTYVEVIAQALGEAARASPLQYFSLRLFAEARGYPAVALPDHPVLGGTSATATLFTVSLPAPVQAEALTVVDQTFAAFDALFDALFPCLRESTLAGVGAAPTGSEATVRASRAP